MMVAVPVLVVAQRRQKRETMAVAELETKGHRVKMVVVVEEEAELGTKGRRVKMVVAVAEKAVAVPFVETLKILKRVPMVHCLCFIMPTLIGIIYGGCKVKATRKR